MRMGVIALEAEIVRLIVEQPLPALGDGQARELARLAAKLEPGLVEVVGIKVNIPAGPHEHARLKPAFPRQHMGQEGVAGDVERHPEEQVGAALVELEVKAASGDL